MTQMQRTAPKTGRTGHHPSFLHAICFRQRLILRHRALRTPDPVPWATLFVKLWPLEPERLPLGDVCGRLKAIAGAASAAPASIL